MKFSMEFFNDGPLNDSIKNAEEFAIGMYFSHCFKESMDYLAQIEQEYAKLLKTNDIEAITQKKKEIDFYENIILLASSANNEDNKIIYD
jgi:hypothetical protein